jgi:hypothetical protein
VCHAHALHQLTFPTFLHHGAAELLVPKATPPIPRFLALPPHAAPMPSGTLQMLIPPSLPTDTTVCSSGEILMAATALECALPTQYATPSS